MKQISISEARRLLPRLLGELAESGEPVLITRRGKALGKLVPAPADGSETDDPTPLRGLPLGMSDDFDAPLEGEWEALET
ncbi:MAG: type II toxin-antitoxin system Phd/YefM family antitoxin [Polyangia bacterium]